MSRKFLIVLFCILITLREGSSLELLANYKFWKSASTQILYDYSGNSRHGTLNTDYLATDRGVAPYDFYFINLMGYAFISRNIYNISFWILTRMETCEIAVAYFHELGHFHISHYPTGSAHLLADGNVDKSDSISLSTDWNLHTVSMWIDSSIPNKVHFILYQNLVFKYSNFLDLPAAYIKMTDLHFGHREAITNTGSILYELWIHTGLSNISELSSLISVSSSCGCSYDCPTSPSIVCLPTHPKTSNYQGQACSTSCISNLESCSTTSSCIPKFKAECKYGLYDIVSSECLFFCPGNSCNCSTVTDSITQIKSLNCSCITGYKSISSNPPACISNQCLTHHPEGYRHICDVTEVGYILDSVGDCCICAPNYTQVSSNPIVCMNIPHCLSYILSSRSYICSSCALGYKVDSQGNCNECDTNYTMVHNDPVICEISIDHCLSYAYYIDTWKCQTCDKGYLIDSNLSCNQCDNDYINYSLDPFTCTPKIENCSSYKQTGEEFICELCNIGYKLSTSGQCDECDTNYSRVESESGTCEPDILNCLDYEISEKTLKCISCDEGYSIDLDYECKDCDAGYIKLPQESSICIREINNCSEYGLYQRKWVCIECTIGNQLDEGMKCNLCASGYTYSENSTNECILMSDSAESSDNLDNEEEDAVSSIQINRGEVLESSNNIAITITIVSNSVSSMLSLDSNTIILYINTIKILSFIQYLNINMPYEIQKQQGSTSNYMKKINILSYMKIQNEDIDDYIRSISDNDLSFLSQTNYQIAILLLIFILNALIYYIVKYTKGKLKDYAGKILKYFKYTIYIQFSLIAYLDLAYSAVSKIIYVRYI